MGASRREIDDRFAAGNPGDSGRDVFLPESFAQAGGHSRRGHHLPRPRLERLRASNGRAENGDGCFAAGLDGPVLLRPTDISDGLSNTLFVAERYLGKLASEPPKNPDAFAGYAIGNSGDTECISGWGKKAFTPLSDRATKPKRYTGYFFGSSHRRGINAGFGDGSVRSVSFTVSAATWFALCSRNDGGVPGNDL